jgi:uncharacterized protein YecT (DUF1311 family)
MHRPSALALATSLSLFACAEPLPPAAPEPPSIPSISVVALPGAPAASSRAPHAGAGDASAPPDSADTGFFADALACLDDLGCSAAEADRLFRAAADAQESEVDCLRFADGDGTAKDAARARACLERAVARMKCDGSSAGLWQAELAIALTDGVGGPVDVARARAIFLGCFDDGTKQQVLDHAAARDKNPAAPPVDFCKELGGTTLTTNECFAREQVHERTRGALEAKRVATSLDDEGKRLLVAASRVHARYVAAMGAYVYEVYIQGSMRNMQALGFQNALLSRRTQRLARLPSLAPAAASLAAAERASKAVDAALKKRAAAAVPEVAAKLADTQKEWLAYRDAEVALYLHARAAPGAGTTPAAWRRAVLVALEDARAEDLRGE